MTDEHAMDTGAPSGLTRRQFLQTMAASSAAGAVVFTGCQPGHPIPETEFQMESRVRLAEDVASSYENYYATTCRGCDAGCGLIVRIVDGRAKKVEGNPDHPVNRGKTCVRAQSVVQEEYLPDRIQGPMRRDRASNRWSPITWDEALTELVKRLRETRGADAVFITGPARGQKAVLLERFSRAYGAAWMTLDASEEAPLREATRRVFGQDRLPEFDIENARYVLSFGADFLSSWLSPVHYGMEYGNFRQGSYRPGQFQPRQGRPRGHLVQVEPRMSSTAANADEWVFLKPGTEGMLATGMAQVILAENLGDAEGARAVNTSAIRAVPMDQIVSATGVPLVRIQQLARDFASKRPSVAFGGGVAGAHTNGTDNLAAILTLNVLVGSVGRSGGVVFNPPSPFESAAAVRPAKHADWQQAADKIRQKQTQLVLLADANPVYSLPGVPFREALNQAAFVVSFSSFVDETTALADMVLPSHLPLEDWGDDVPEPGPGFQVVSIQQPVVRPMYDTRPFGDVLLTAADELGGATKAALPWRSFQDMIREGARSLQQQRRGSVQAPDFERFWTLLLQRGGWWDESRTQAATGPGGSQGASAALKAPQYAGSDSEYPYHLVAFPHPALGDGGAAHLPWLQGLPEPMTSVAWQTWVEVNPKRAAELGLREGDVVTIESPNGKADLPVYINPAASPTVLAVPMGQGHSEYGRYASRDGKMRGANVLSLVAPLADETTGALAYGATRVKLTRTGRRAQLPKFEGTVPAYQVPHEEVVKVTRDA